MGTNPQLESPFTSLSDVADWTDLGRLVVQAADFAAEVDGIARPSRDDRVPAERTEAHAS